MKKILFGIVFSFIVIGLLLTVSSCSKEPEENDVCNITSPCK